MAWVMAAAHNCDCSISAEGIRVSTCASHQMMTKDQRAMDGLLWARNTAADLQRREFRTNEGEPE